jgi:hypothetical protein
MNTFHLRFTFLLALLLASGLAACGESRQPVVVFVTPTPQPPADSPVAPTHQPPTATAVPPTSPPGATPTPSAPPAVAALATATPTAPAPALPFGPIVAPGTPTVPTLTNTPPGPTPAVPFGPIVGPGHTLVPTETPIPPTLGPVLVPTSVASLPPGVSLRRDLLGVQIHPHIDSREFDRVLAYAQGLGVTWIKYQFNWSALESAPGQFTDLFFGGQISFV